MSRRVLALLVAFVATMPALVPAQAVTDARLEVDLELTAKARGILDDLEVRTLETIEAFHAGTIPVVDANDPAGGFAVTEGDGPTRLRRIAGPPLPPASLPPSLATTGVGGGGSPPPPPPKCAGSGNYGSAQPTNPGSDPLGLNLPPGKPLGTCIPATGFTGLEIEFSARAADPETGDLRYEWDWGDGTTSKSGWSGSAVWTAILHVYTVPGTYSVRVRAEDAFGAIGPWSDARLIAVSTRAPLTPSAPTGPASVQTGVVKWFAATTTDPDGDMVRYIFDWGDGTTSTSAYTASGASRSMSHSWATPGTYSVKVTAEDTHGAKSGASEAKTVTATSRPPATPAAPTAPADPRTGVALTYTATTSDPDGNDVRYAFTFESATGATETRTTDWRPSGATASVSYTWTAPGTHKVRVQAEDVYGMKSGTSADKSHLVRSRAPTAPTSAPAGPSSGETGVSYTYFTTASDPDGDNVRYLLRWGDGATSFSAEVPSGSSGSASHTWSAPGTYAVTASAWDVHGEESASSPARSVTIVSRAPLAPVVRHLPASGETGIAYLPSFEATDPDGDNVRFEIVWSQGDTQTTSLVASGVPLDVSHAWSSPGTHAVTARAIDVHGREGPWSTPIEVVMKSRNPLLPAAPTFPADPRTNTDLSFTAVTTDPDGDNVRFTFRFSEADGSTTSKVSGWTPSGTATSVSHAWASPGTYTATAQAEDVHGERSAESNPASIVVRSQRPATFGAPGGPSSVQTGLEYEYTSGTTDPDGDALTYRFTWGDGTSTTLPPVASGAQVAVTHTWTSPGTYAVTVRATDPYGEVRTSSAKTVTVVSRGPETPAAPQGPASVTVRFEAAFSATGTDPDGDSVRLTFHWGDGTTTVTDFVPSGTIVTATHAWGSIGSFTVRVSAEDANGVASALSPSATITVTSLAPYPPALPAHDVVYFGTYGNVGEPQTFRAITADPENHLVEYRFDFGDGTVRDWSGLVTGGTEHVATRHFAAVGTFNVRVQARDEFGVESAWSPALPFVVYAANTAPLRAATPVGPTIVSGSLSADVTFQGADLDVGDWVRYRVDWGDGTVSHTPFVPNDHRSTIMHTWPGPGTYDVVAITEDHRGGSGAASLPLRIVVHPPTLLADDFEDGAIGSQWNPATQDPAVTESGGALRIEIDHGGALTRSKSLPSDPIAKTVNGNDGFRVDVAVTPRSVATTPPSWVAGIRIVNADLPTQWIELYQQTSSNYVRRAHAGGSAVNVAAPSPTAEQAWSVAVDGGGYVVTVGTTTTTRIAYTGFANAQNIRIELFARTDSTAITSDRWHAAFHDVAVRPYLHGTAPGTATAPTGGTTPTTGESTPYMLRLTSAPGVVRFLLDWGDGTTSLSHWFTAAIASAGTGTIDRAWETDGTFSVKAKAVDTTLRESASWSSALTVRPKLPNVPPTAPERPTGPLTGETGVSVSFSTAAADRNGDSLTYTFDWGDGTTSTTTGASGARVTRTHPYVYPGWYGVTVAARDPMGEETWGEVAWIEIRSRAPATPATPTLVTVSPGHGDYVTVKARASDPDVDDMYIEFQMFDERENVVYDWGYIFVQSNEWAFLETTLWEGTYKFRARSWDIHGESNGLWSSWLTVNVGPPNYAPDPPSADDIRGVWEGYAGQPYDWWARGQDWNGGTLQMEFDWGDSTATTTTGSVPVGQFARASHTYSTPGWYDLSFRAKDPTGRVSSWYTVSIRMNSLPTSIQSPSTPGVVTAPAATTLIAWREYSFTATATDPQGDRVRYLFNFGDGLEHMTGSVPSGTPVTVSHRFEWPGSFNVRVLAFDDVNEKASAFSSPRSVAVAHIPNDPPALPSAVTGPKSVEINDGGSWTFRATDPNGDKVRYHVNWGDGSPIETSAFLTSGTSWTIGHAFTATGSYPIMMWAEDAHNEGGPAIAHVVRVEPHRTAAGSYFESFETGASGWVYAGDAHVSSHRPYTGWASLYFGNEIARTYEKQPRTWEPNAMSATSPAIAVPAQDPLATFWTWYVLESTSSRDTMRVEILSASNQILAVKPLGKASMGAWHQETIDLAPYAGTTVKLRFAFDTVTGSANAFEGWYVDRLQVFASGSAPAPHDDLVSYESDVILQEVGRTTRFESRAFDGSWDERVLVDDGRDSVVKTIRIHKDVEFRNVATFKLEFFGDIPSCRTNPTSGVYHIVVNGATVVRDLCPLARESGDFRVISIPLDASLLRDGYNTFQIVRGPGADAIVFAAEYPTPDDPATPTHETKQRSQERSSVVVDGAPLDLELVWRVAAEVTQDAYTITWYVSIAQFSDGEGNEKWRYAFDAVVFFSEESGNSLRLYWRQDETKETLRGWANTKFIKQAAYAANDPRYPVPHYALDPEVDVLDPSYAGSPVVGTVYRWYDLQMEVMDPETGAFHPQRYVQLSPVPADPLPQDIPYSHEEDTEFPVDFEVYLAIGPCPTMGYPGGPHGHSSGVWPKGNYHGHNCFDFRIGLTGAWFDGTPTATDIGEVGMAFDVLVIARFIKTAKEWGMAAAEYDMILKHLENAGTFLMFVERVVAFVEGGEYWRWTFRELDRTLNVGFASWSVPLTKAENLNPDPFGIIGVALGPAGSAAMGGLSVSLQTVGWPGHHVWRSDNSLWRVGWTT